MDDLDHGSQAHGALAAVVEQFGRKKEQGGADSFAAAGAQVFSNFGDGLNVRNCVAPELALQRDEVVAQQIEYFFPFVGGGCAQMELRLRTTGVEGPRCEVCF